MDTKKTEIMRGPIAFLNWRAAIDDRLKNGAQEVPLYSDVPLWGEVNQELGPYQIFNNIVYESPRQAIYQNYTLYMEYFLNTDDLPKLDKTDVTGFHGGSIEDEVAALCSLEMGVRIKAGGIVRVYTQQDAPRGRPRIEEPGKVPYVPHARYRPRILPHTAVSRSLKIDLLKEYPKLAPRDASALARSARYYQEAIWIAESTPELSWLMLVSAIEVAASAWKQSLVGTNKELLEELNPKLCSVLKKAAGDTHVSEVADMLAHLLSSTKKFLSFLIEFLPPEPPNRPDSHLQLKWSKGKLKEAFSKVYEARSTALHAGIPIPPLMCDPPQDFEGRYPEVPTSLGASTKGGAWTVDAAPMLLHTFEYIVRGSLLRWWESLIKQQADRLAAAQPLAAHATDEKQVAQPAAHPTDGDQVERQAVHTADKPQVVQPVIPGLENSPPATEQSSTPRGSGGDSAGPAIHEAPNLNDTEKGE